VNECSIAHRKRQRTHGSLEVVSTQGIKERPLPRGEHRTGLDYEQLLYLEREVAARIGSWQPATGRRKALDLFEAIILTLIYLRHNTVRAAVGEQARISQATVSRYIETLEPVVSCCPACLAIDLQRRAARGDLVVDGFLIPTRDLLPDDRRGRGGRRELDTAGAAAHLRLVDVRPGRG